MTRPLPAAASADAGGSADASSSGSDASGAAAADAAVVPKKSSSLTKRAVFGTILGLGGAVVILVGDWLYAAAACLVAFQCSKEYVGLVNAKGISAGMKPPPPIVSSAITLLCVALNAWAFVSGGKTASAMAVATFIILSLQLVASDKPRFSQLTSAVFGLVYCGKSIE
jgi:phosphatidate cytidylyltransferase